jgi:hypothetical protein
MLCCLFLFHQVSPSVSNKDFLAMYFGRHQAYRNELHKKLKKISLPEPTLAFYDEFYCKILPRQEIVESAVNNTWVQKLLKVYQRDRALLQEKKIKITGALATLCEVRGFDNPYAWHTYYAEHYNAKVKAIPGYHLFVAEPLDRRFSLRLAEVDPMFFGQIGYYKHRPILGCENCNFRITGCAYCMSCNRSTYKQTATKNLEMKVLGHSKCRGKGCRLCFNRARCVRRRRVILGGLDVAEGCEYIQWLMGADEVDLHDARWPKISRI